jgi:hypothetical protein
MDRLDCEYRLEPGKGRFLWKDEGGNEHLRDGPVALGMEALIKLQGAELESEAVFGDCLFATLLPKGSELREEYGKAMAHARALGLGLRFRLVLADTLDKEVRDLAWELIRDPVEGSLALSPWIAFSLFLPYEGLRRADTASSLSKRPRVLVAVADPADLRQQRLAELDGARVRESMHQALCGSVDCNVLKESVTLSTLRGALEQGRYEVLHLIAHSCEQGLVLETERGLAAAVRVDDLVAILGNRSTLRALVLMACSQGGHQGLAEQLVRRGVPVALGMRREVGLPSLEVFASAFYPRLAETGEVDVATNAAREALLAKPATRCDWSGVVLWTSLRDGRVWHPALPSEPPVRLTPPWLRAAALAIPLLLNESAMPHTEPPPTESRKAEPPAPTPPLNPPSPHREKKPKTHPEDTLPAGTVPGGVRKKIQEAQLYFQSGLYDQSYRSYQEAFKELENSAPEIFKKLNRSRLGKLGKTPLAEEAAREFAAVLDPLAEEPSTFNPGDVQ